MICNSIFTTTLHVLSDIHLLEDSLIDHHLVRLTGEGLGEEPACARLHLPPELLAAPEYQLSC